MGAVCGAGRRDRIFAGTAGRAADPRPDLQAGQMEGPEKLFGGPVQAAPSGYLQAAALLDELPVQQQADIMEMQTERSMELRQDIRKFSEENPEIAAQMVRNWLREGESK